MRGNFALVERDTLDDFGLFCPWRVRYFLLDTQHPRTTHNTSLQHIIPYTTNGTTNKSNLAKLPVKDPDTTFKITLAVALEVRISRFR